ncbi:MAG: hypothetical protein WA876_16565, partial [Candidatus Acidiferrales bacterium]
MQQESPSPLGAYSKRSQELQLLLEQTNERRGKWLSISVFLCLLVCALLYESFATKKTPYGSAAVPIIVLAFAARRALQHRARVLKLLDVSRYYDKSIARLKHEWDSLDDGKEFIDPDHIYATDLDLFGRGSLFQLLCSARTHLGRGTLASWMKSQAPRQEVLARRNAISELGERRQLLESVAAAGNTEFSNCRSGTFEKWTAEMSSLPAFPSFAAPLALLLAPLLIVLPCLFWAAFLSLQSLWLCLIAVLALEAILGSSFREHVRSVIQSVQVPSVELPIICELLAIIEREKFSSKRLSSLAQRLKNRQCVASIALRRLSRFIHLLDWESNMPLFFFLWGTQLAMAIDRWYRRHGSDLLNYLSALGEFEALLSLSSYTFEHPRDVFPEIIDGGPLFDATQLGHPLLDETICVSNDVRLDDKTRFLIVSGSNMSGKSTFLRAIGTNAVLAWMGAPVRCAKLRISEMQIAAAIRVQDSI